MTYSIAIRTLGTAGEKFRQELESIRAQTLLPDRVLVYIAEGYPRPGFTVGREEYIPVKKGMFTQRALPYDEVTSDCILLLDDDVLLAPDSAERLLQAMEANNADCVAADVFRNHAMPLRTKLFAAVTAWALPHGGPKWAFRMRRSGSFSYNARPVESYYASQTCGCPAMLWRKSALHRIHLEDECWIEIWNGPCRGDGMRIAGGIVPLSMRPSGHHFRRQGWFSGSRWRRTDAGGSHL